MWSRGGVLEVGGEPDMRGRPGSERGEEEGKGEEADERAPGGSDWKKKKGREEDVGPRRLSWARSGIWAGGGMRWAGLVVFVFFSFFFKSFSNLFQTLFKFKF
jgi:hypothetical protein